MSAERPFGGRKSPYIPQYGNTDFNFICQEAELDPKVFATKDFIAGKGILALIELFSDGELIIADTNSPIVMVGIQNPEQRYGEFYTKMASLWQKAQNLPGSNLDKEFNKLARFCGSAYAEIVADGKPPAGLHSEVQININPQGPGIDYVGYRVKINAGASILDLGPGVAGRKFIDLQGSLLRRSTLMQYMAISNGPFVNQFLIDYGGLTFNKNPELQDLFPELINRSLFIGREDGVYDALNEILTTPQPSGQYDICDIAICNGLISANPEELREGLRLVPQIVKPGGYLLLGAPVERLHEGTLPFDEATKAVAGKFDIVHRVTKRSGSDLLRGSKPLHLQFCNEQLLN